MKRFIMKRDNQATVMESLVSYLNIRNMDKHVQITITEYRKNRSRGQSDFYWTLLTTIGNELGYTKDEMHQLCVYKFIGMRSKEVAGQRIEYLPSTTKMKVSEMCDYITQIEVWAAGMGIALPYREVA